MQLIEQRLEFVVADFIACRWRRDLRRRNGRCRGGELTLAMQLVEQRLEFVVADLVTDGDRCGGGLQRDIAHHWRRGELALAVQLIEQRLELVIADFVAASAAVCLLAWRLGQRIEQLLELAVGDIASGQRWRLANSLGNGLRQRNGSRRFGQTRQGRQQFAGGRRRGDALAHFAEHAVDRIQRFQHYIHQFGVDAPLTLAQDVEDVFCDMAAFHQLIELEKTGTTFDGMEPAKNSVEQIHVVRAAFKLHQLLGQ
ncbi:hypothetical protein D3C84_147600 [compost metagenome]